MKKETLDAFIKYAKDKFGYDISIKQTNTPDSFESIFGASFLGQDNANIALFDDFDTKTTYINSELKVSCDFSSTIVDCELTQEIGLAA